MSSCFECIYGNVAQVQRTTNNKIKEHYIPQIVSIYFKILHTSNTYDLALHAGYSGVMMRKFG
jgi:hypothetical protein